MGNPVGADLVEARMRDMGQTAINQTVSLFKGGTFALAAVLLLEILVTPEGRLVRLVLWTASFVAALTSYSAYMNNAALDFRATVSGVILIIAQMMAEIMLFAALTPRFADQAWRLWLPIHTVLLIFTAIRMLTIRMNEGVAIAPALAPLIAAIERSRRRAAPQLLGNAALAFATAVPVLLLPKDSPWPAWLSIGAALILMVGALFGLVGQHHLRAAMERDLAQALAAA